MAKDMFACNFSLIPRGIIKIEGEIPPDAKQFKLKLGKDYFNIAMQINPIFNNEGEEKVILYNYMTESMWREEKKINKFPFVPGSMVEICINFVGNYFTTTLPENVELNFFNYLFLHELNFFQVSGDFKVHKLAVD